MLCDHPSVKALQTMGSQAEILSEQIKISSLLVIIFQTVCYLSSHGDTLTINGKKKFAKKFIFGPWDLFMMQLIRGIPSLTERIFSSEIRK